MSSKAWLGLLGGLSCCLVAGVSQAQCRMDNDCPGDQVCEKDTCVAPQALPPAPPPPAAAAAPVATTPPPATPARASIAAEPLHDVRVEPAKPLTRRHSTAMMVVGIIMTSIGPIPLLMSIGYSSGKSSCRSGGIFGGVADSSSDCNRNDGAMYGTLALGLGLLGAGIPLIVVGSKRVPIARASLTPWAAPGAGGLSLRLDL